MPSLSFRSLVREAKKREAAQSEVATVEAETTPSPAACTPSSASSTCLEGCPILLPEKLWNRRVFVRGDDSSAQWQVQRIDNAVNPCVCARLLAYLEAEDNAGKYAQLRGRRVLKLGGDVTDAGLDTQDCRRRGEFHGIPPLLQALLGELGEKVFNPHHRGAGGAEEAGEGCGGSHADKTPNHVLVNRYLPGDGILPHTDGPSYYPFVAILSLKSMVGGFEFYTRSDGRHTAAGTGTPHPEPSVVCSVPLPANSLLLFRERAYGEWLHGISAQKYDGVVLEEEVERPLSLGESKYFADKHILQRGERYSLTIRYVPPSVVSR